MKRSRGGKPTTAATAASAAGSAGADNDAAATDAAAASSSAAAAAAPSASASAASAASDAMDDAPINGYTEPLIGPAYQVHVPPFTGPPSAASVASGTQLTPSGALISAMTDAQSGTALWNPNLLVIKGSKAGGGGGDAADKKREALDRYLATIDGLFYKDGARHIDHSKALYFLHQCDYSISRALALLKPWPAPVEDDSLGLNEEEMYPADDFCGICRDGGNLVLCDLCGNKAYHPACVALESIPSGAWNCPYHQCAVCKIDVPHGAPPPPSASASSSAASQRPSSFSCSMCPTSYCSAHIPAELKIRAAAIGAFEPMCGPCLAKEEEYYAVQADKGHSGIGYSCRRSFMHRLQMVLKRESRQLVRMPILAQREMDLYGLYIAVCRRGGLAGVIGATTNPAAAAAAAAAQAAAAGSSASSSAASSAAAAAAAAASSSSGSGTGTGWRDIRRLLRLPPSIHPHLNSLLRRFYLHILYPYEKQFYPHFTPLTLKRALKEDQKNDEEQEDDEDDAALFAPVPVVAASASQKKKKASAAAAAAAAAASTAAAGGESFPFLAAADLAPDPALKDDLRPDDILLSLKVGSSAAGVAMAAGGAASTKASKEQRARSKKAKEKAKEDARRRAEKDKKKVAKRAKELKGAAGRNQRSRRDGAASGTRGAGAGGAGGKKGAKAAPSARSGENACINIYTPTPWALAANAAATHARNVLAAQAEAAAAAEAEALAAAAREANGGSASADPASAAAASASAEPDAEGEGDEDDAGSAEEGEGEADVERSEAEDGEGEGEDGDEDLAAETESPAAAALGSTVPAGSGAAQQQSLLLSAYAAASAATTTSGDAASYRDALLMHAARSGSSAGGAGGPAATAAAASAAAPLSLASAETLDDEDLEDAEAAGKDHKKQRIQE